MPSPYTPLYLNYYDFKVVEGSYSVFVVTSPRGILFYRTNDRTCTFDASYFLERCFSDHLCVSQIRSIAMSFLKKPSADSQGNRSLPSFSDDVMKRNYPALYEYLTSTTYPDGSKRETSTILVFVDDGQLKVCLNDRETSLMLWSSGESFEESLLVMDELLRSDNPPWRESKSKKKR